MNLKGLNDLALACQKKALKVLHDSRIAGIWNDAGCRVNLVGSLRMGLLAKHRDIDLHVYSSGITTGNSFAIAAKIAENPNVTEIKCINGLQTDEHCIAWHVSYKATYGEIWQFDIIHIEETPDTTVIIRDMGKPTPAKITILLDTLVPVAYPRLKRGELRCDLLNTSHSRRTNSIDSFPVMSSISIRITATWRMHLDISAAGSTPGEYLWQSSIKP